MNKIILFLAVTISATLSAQSDESLLMMQIDELHVPTKHIQDSVSVIIKDCNLLLKETTDVAAKRNLNKRLTELWAIYDNSLRDQVRNDINFAMQHPDSQECLSLLISRMQTQEGQSYYHDYQRAFDNLSPRLKASERGIRMAEKLKYFKRSMVGSVAPQFTYDELRGQTIRLADFQNQKYILLDFWASWCAPCLEDQEHLKNIYDKYKSRGLEIISVSQDTDGERWKKAIDKQQIGGWKHIRVTTENCSTNEPNAGGTAHSVKKIQKEYYVSGIPHYVLIDKNGVIVGKWKGSGELNMQQLDALLAESLLP